MFYFDRISHSLLYLTHHIRLGFILVINMFATPLESELSLSEMGSLHLSTGTMWGGDVHLQIAAKEAVRFVSPQAILQVKNPTCTHTPWLYYHRE